jgi:pimeloyl-ACP methyl ester carboxylesterase
MGRSDLLRGPREDHVTTDDGVRLFAQTVGTGASAVIIPNAVYLFDPFRHLTNGRTLIFFDMRNRGHSDHVSDSAKLHRGILQDVDDLEAVRRHFGFERIHLIGHSYLGMMVILYAMKYPDRVNRVVQIGPGQPFADRQYPTHADAALVEISAKLADLQKERPPSATKEFCKKWWAVARAMFVANPADADRIAEWGFCDLPNELHLMKHWVENIAPSIRSLSFTEHDYAKVKAPVLTIHGMKDRNAPYGGGREWARLSPCARLLTIADAAHVPWIEAPEIVFGAIETFLDGAWPDTAHPVTGEG